MLCFQTRAIITFNVISLYFLSIQLYANSEGYSTVSKSYNRYHLLDVSVQIAKMIEPKINQ